MDFSLMEVVDDSIIIKDVQNCNLEHIFECGQCFRWNKQSSGSYIGVAYGRVIEVEKKGNDIIIYNTTKEDVEGLWCDYFDLYTNYSEIKNNLSADPLLKQSIDFGYGIRLLKQDPFELVISFIISANNRIPMIKRAIQKISETWGDELKYKGKTYYSFPTVEKLNKTSIEEIEDCSVGFRAKYIKDTVDKIYNKEFDLQYIKGLDDDLCHKELQKFNGVGPKVSDCIMLFSMQKYSAFPVDVWVKRAMQHFYLAPDVSLPKIREFARNKFADLSGFAQQYLFYYARENNIKIE